MTSHYVEEFACTGCGALVVRFFDPGHKAICSTCRFLPGWQTDPHLIRIFGPAAKPIDRMLCEDCPPVGYPTDETRCTECPRRRT